MKLCVSVLVLILVPSLVTGKVSSCSFDDVINSIASQYFGNVKLECSSITDRSSYASCPEGYTATSCSCGMGCGSWDIQSPNKCHCQCGGMDWTTAVCCRNKIQ